MFHISFIVFANLTRGECSAKPKQNTCCTKSEAGVYEVDILENQIDNSRNTVTSSRSMGLSFLMALVNGTYTIWSFSIPIITLR